jgi:sentrin-specific protease 1
MSSIFDGWRIKSGSEFGYSDDDHDSLLSDDTDDASRLACAYSAHYSDDICCTSSDDGRQNRFYENLMQQYKEANQICDFRKMEFCRGGIKIFDCQEQAFTYCDKFPYKWQSIFASDVPKKPKPDDVKLRMAKFYMVGTPMRFFRVFSTVRHIVADEVIRMKSGCPVPLYFDVEIKNEDGRKWKKPEDIDPHHLTHVRTTIKNLIEGLKLNSGDEFVNTLAEEYSLLSHGVWTEMECREGLCALTSDITDRLKLMLESQIKAGIIEEKACEQMHVTSSCREKKFSFHIVMDRIFCDHQSLSMPLVVHDLKGWFMKDNLQWLISNDRLFHTPVGRFRIRALMVNELVLQDSGVFNGKGGTPFDQAVYSPNHLLRSVMSSKFCFTGGAKLPMVPLHPSVYDRKVKRDEKLLGVFEVMTDSVKTSFGQIFRSDDDIAQWRNFTVTCRAFVDSSPSQMCYVIARLKPSMWDYYPSKMTWSRHHKKYSQDFDGITYTCDLVDKTVTSLYGGKAGCHYSETRVVKNAVECASSNDVDDLVYEGDSVKCSPFDRVRSESGKPCYLYQLNPDDQFFCSKGLDTEKSPSAHLLQKSTGGIIYACFCKNCEGTVYRSTPKENLIDIVERRYPYMEEETLVSDDANAKFRGFDNNQDHANVELERGRESLFDKWKDQDRLDKYAWERVVKDVLEMPDGSGPRFYIIDAPCETGKTFEMQQLCKATQELGGRYMFVVHRRSLADLMYQQNRGTGCCHYQDFPPEKFWDNADDHGQLCFHFVSVYNSLHRFGYGGKPDVLILDEAALLRRHIINKTTRHCLASSHMRFVSLVKEAKLVILLQHIVSLEDARFFTSLADVDPQDRSKVVPLLVKKPTTMHPLKITKRHAVAVKMLMEKYVASFESSGGHDDDDASGDTGQFVGREVSSNASSAISSLTWSARRVTETGVEGREHQSHTCNEGEAVGGAGYRRCREPFVVFSTKKSDSAYFAKSLKAKAVEIGADPARIKLVTASLKQADEWNRHFFQDPNERASDCDVLIATSVIGSGVSLDTHFGSFVAFLYSGILTVDDDWQLIRRCRVGASLRDSSIDRTSILYIEQGGGGSNCIDIMSAVEEGGRFHADIVSDVTRKYNHKKGISAKIAEVTQLKESLYFDGLNRTYWTNVAERKKSRSKHDELWKKRLEETLRPGTFESVDDSHGYSEAELAALDEDLKKWNRVQEERTCRNLGRGYETSRLVPAEDIVDEDIEALLDRLGDDDVLKLALSQQAVECSLSWNNAFPRGLDYVAEVIAMKLFASLKKPITAKKKESLRITFARHMSNKRWRNKYIRMAFGLCNWTAAFYSSSDDWDGLFGTEVLYDTQRIYEHIGGAAINGLAKTKVCKALLPLLFTANPKELPYIITPAQSPFYIGLVVAHHKSLCSFFHWAFAIPEEPGGVDECPIDTTLKEKFGTMLSVTERRLLCKSAKHILSHYEQQGQKLTLVDLVSDEKAAHNFVKYLGRHIGLDIRSAGSFSVGGSRVTRFQNYTCMHDLALSLAIPTNVRNNLVSQLPKMKASHNLPEEGKELVREALSLYATVNSSLGRACDLPRWDSVDQCCYFTVPQRQIEREQCDIARKEADEKLLIADHKPEHGGEQSALESAVVRAAFERVEAREKQFNDGDQAGLFRVFHYDDDEETDNVTLDTTKHKARNMFIEDEAFENNADEEGYSNETNDFDVFKRKRGQYGDEVTVTTCAASSLSGSFPISVSSTKSPSKSPLAKKRAHGTSRESHIYSSDSEPYESSQDDQFMCEAENQKRRVNHEKTNYSPQKKKQQGQCRKNALEASLREERDGTERQRDDNDCLPSKRLFANDDYDIDINNNGCEDAGRTDAKNLTFKKSSTSDGDNNVIGSEADGDDKTETTDCSESVGKPNGLTNKSVTCYTNVIFQCLATDIIFVATKNATEEHRLQCKQNTLNIEGSDRGGTILGEVNSAKQRMYPMFNAQKRARQKHLKPQCVLCMLHDLSQQIRRGDCKTIAPNHVAKAVISQHNEQLSLFSQQDPHEFLDLTLKCMEKCTDTAEPGDVSSVNKPNAISQIFRGADCVVTKCRKCSHKSTKIDPMGIWLLHIPNCIVTKTLDIKRLLEAYHEEQNVSDYRCDNCGSKATATRTSTMSAPPILTILLKLTEYNANGASRSKNNAQIKLNKTLQVGKNNTTYRLFAVVVHEGDRSESGHYIVYVKNFGRWFKCNDTKVIFVLESEVFDMSGTTHKSPHMVFYVEEQWVDENLPKDKFLRFLDSDEEQIVSQARDTPASTIERNGDKVKPQSMRRLRDGTWLNDEVINFYLKHCLNQKDKLKCIKSPGRKRSHFFSTYFVQNLFDDRNDNHKLRGKYNYNSVKRWGNKVPGKDIFNLKYLFCPINLDDLHWALACICMEQKKIIHLDSIRKNDETRLGGLLKYLKDEWKEKKEGHMDWNEWELVQCQDTPQQNNGESLIVWRCSILLSNNEYYLTYQPTCRL